MARQTGNAAATAATAAKKFNQDHNITGKLYDATSAAASKALDGPLGKGKKGKGKKKGKR